MGVGQLLNEQMRVDIEHLSVLQNYVEEEVPPLETTWRGLESDDGGEVGARDLQLC